MTKMYNVAFGFGIVALILGLRAADSFAADKAVTPMSCETLATAWRGATAPTVKTALAGRMARQGCPVLKEMAKAPPKAVLKPAPTQIIVRKAAPPLMVGAPFDITGQPAVLVAPKPGPEVAFADSLTYDVYVGGDFSSIGRGGVATGNPAALSGNGVSGNVGLGVRARLDNAWSVFGGIQLNTGKETSKSEGYDFTYCTAPCGGVVGHRPGERVDSVKLYPSADLKIGVAHQFENWMGGANAFARMGTMEWTSRNTVPASGPLAAFDVYNVSGSAFVVRPGAEAFARYTADNGVFGEAAIGYVGGASVKGVSIDGEGFARVGIGYTFK